MKNMILKIVTGIAVCGLIISACMLDSISNVPMYTAVCCMAWITIFIYANYERFV